MVEMSFIPLYLGSPSAMDEEVRFLGGMRSRAALRWFRDTIKMPPRRGVSGMSNWAGTWGRRTQSGEIMFLSYLTIPLKALEAVTGGREHLGISALDFDPKKPDPNSQ